MELSKKNLKIRVSEELFELIELKAKEKDSSISEIVRTALSLYLTAEVGNDELIFDALHNVINTVRYLDRKVESFSNLWFYHLTTFFVNTIDISQKSAEEQRIIIERANERKYAMLEAFKSSMKTKPSVFEAMLADFFEHENRSEEVK